MAFRCIELFAGAGGAALGLHQAGIHHTACVEWDADACTTLRAARDAGLIDTDEIIKGDVREVDWSRFDAPDLLRASFPCQGWSTAGKRLGARDPRNGWPWTVDVIDALRPTWVVCENVPGLLMHSAEGHPNPDDCPACYEAAVIRPQLEERFAWVGVWVLDAADFGTPQRRSRVFWVAGPRPVAIPAPTHADPEVLKQASLFETRRPWVTVREALGLDATIYSAGTTGEGRPTAPTAPTAAISGKGTVYAVIDVERGSGMTERHGERRMPTIDEPAPSVRARTNGAAPMAISYRRGRDGGAVDEEHSLDEPSCALRGSEGGSSQPFLVQREDPSRGWEDSDPDAPAPSVRSGRPGGGIALLDMPSPAVTAQEVKGTRASKASGYTFNGGPDRASDMLFMATGRRRLTPAECAALFAMPPEWPWRGTRTSQYRQIGNMCAHPVVGAIGQAVKDEHERGTP